MSPRFTTDDEIVWIDHEGVQHETDKAKLFLLADDRTIWIPKSVIEDENEELVGVKKWWAEKSNVRGSW